MNFTINYIDLKKAMSQYIGFRSEPSWDTMVSNLRCVKYNAFVRTLLVGVLSQIRALHPFSAETRVRQGYIGDRTGLRLSYDYFRVIWSSKMKTREGTPDQDWSRGQQHFKEWIMCEETDSELTNQSYACKRQGKIELASKTYQIDSTQITRERTGGYNCRKFKQDF